MAATLITGPHRSGKSRALWRRLRGEAPGAAALIVPAQGLRHDLVRDAHAWGGDGFLPPVLTLAELVERCAAGVGDATQPLQAGTATHLMRAFCRERLGATRWRRLAGFRACARELADLALRLDDHAIDDARLAAAAREAHAEGDARLAETCAVAAAARAHLAQRAAAIGASSRGAALARLVASGPAVPWRALYLDDFLGLTPAELALLRRLADERALVMTAVDDPRLGDGALAPRLRREFPDAAEERLPAPRHEAFVGDGPQRVCARALVDDAPFDDEGAVSAYRYRDEAHAARAIGAWLRRSGVAPARATLYVPAADGDALALADGLIAAGVPVRGRFEIAYAGTAEGALLLALGRWCARGDLDALLDVGERLAPATGAEPPPLALAELRRPWGAQPCDEALARWRAMRAGGARDGWGWREPDAQRPWLTATLAWLERLRATLAGEGAWHERLRALVARLALGDDARAVVAALDDLARLDAVGVDELGELVDARRVRAIRGGELPEDRALIVADAVRGRTGARPVAILHGLEHARWPRPAATGTLLSAHDRRALARALGADVYDETARAAGETAAFLAVLARGRARVALGIPCGEREPSAWLTALAGQLGWDLEGERARANHDASPGAPLGPHDSQGAAERALWSAEPARPSAVFAVPPGLHADLRASQLNDVAGDSFALVCDWLALGPLAEDRRALDEGNELHDLLVALVESPPQDWAAVASRRLRDWAELAPDAVRRAARRRYVLAAIEAVRADAEDVLAGGFASAVAERKVAITIDVPGHSPLAMDGRIDRIDTLPDGSTRIVDYKRGRIGGFSAAVRDGSEGQLLAYCHGLAQSGTRVAEAWYRALADGGRAGYCGKTPLASEFAPRLARLTAALAAFASGRAVADEDGRSARPGYAEIARLDELRLDLSGAAEEPA